MPENEPRNQHTPLTRRQGAKEIDARIVQLNLRDLVRLGHTLVSGNLVDRTVDDAWLRASRQTMGALQNSKEPAGGGPPSRELVAVFPCGEPGRLNEIIGIARRDIAPLEISAKFRFRFGDGPLKSSRVSELDGCRFVRLECAVRSKTVRLP